MQSLTPEGYVGLSTAAYTTDGAAAFLFSCF